MKSYKAELTYSVFTAMAYKITGAIIDEPSFSQRDERLLP